MLPLVSLYSAVGEKTQKVARWFALELPLVSWYFVVGFLVFRRWDKTMQKRRCVCPCGSSFKNCVRTRTILAGELLTHELKRLYPIPMKSIEGDDNER